MMQRPVLWCLCSKDAGDDLLLLVGVLRAGVDTEAIPRRGRGSRGNFRVDGREAGGAEGVEEDVRVDGRVGEALQGVDGCRSSRRKDGAGGRSRRVRQWCEGTGRRGG